MMPNSIIAEPLDGLLIIREGLQVYLWCVAHLLKKPRWPETKIILCSGQ